MGVPEPLDLVFEGCDLFEVGVLLHEELGLILLQLEDVQVILVHELLVGLLVLVDLPPPLLYLSGLLCLVAGLQLFLLPPEVLPLLDQGLLLMLGLLDLVEFFLELDILVLEHLEFVLELPDLLLLLIGPEPH